jgi:hypothetical protein
MAALRAATKAKWRMNRHDKEMTDE